MFYENDNHYHIDIKKVNAICVIIDHQKMFNMIIKYKICFVRF